MVAPIVWTVFCLALMLVAELRQKKLLMWLAKPAASAGFLAMAVICGAFDSGYGQIIFVGLVLSLFGDVLLIPKENKRAFLGGLVSFLLGHVAYAIAFAQRGVEVTWLGVAAAVVVLVGAVVLRWLWPHLAEQPRMRGPVIAYVVVISVMVALAAGTYPLDWRATIMAGAVAFYVSDLAVARNAFVAPGFANRAWGLPLYYGGQFLLAASTAA